MDDRRPDRCRQRGAHPAIAFSSRGLASRTSSERGSSQLDVRASEVAALAEHRVSLVPCTGAGEQSPMFSCAGCFWPLPVASVGIDSNGDGQGDGIEWGLKAEGGLLDAPQDTDGDNTPDLFDMDNDGDGVPDGKDLAPFAKGSATFAESNPLALTLSNLTDDKSVLVEFQVRPQDQKHLNFAFNVLDWPQDSVGQVRDVDGKSYADLATAQGRAPDANEANGDMKLIPMLSY